MTTRPFVPVEAAERARLGLKATLADCRRIREVWLQRKLDNEHRESGFSTSFAVGCTNELRAIAEEEAAVALDLLAKARAALLESIPLVSEFHGLILQSESRGGKPDISTVDQDVRVELEEHKAVIDRMAEVLAAFEASNADG